MSHEQRIKDGMKMFKKMVSNNGIIFKGRPADCYHNYISENIAEDTRKRKIWGHNGTQTRHAGGGNRNKQFGLHGQLNKTKQNKTK